MNRKLRLFLAEFNTAISSYWACAGIIIAKLTDYFAMPLGVSNFLTATTSLFLVLQPIGGSFYPRIRNKHGYLILFNLVWRICLCFVFFTVLLPRAWGSFLAIVLLIGMNVTFHFCSPAYNDWHVQAVEEQQCHNFYTWRESIYMLLYTVIIAAIQLVIYFTEGAGCLQSGFVISGVILTLLIAISCALLFRLPAPQNTNIEQQNFIKSLFSVFRNKNFSRLIWANATWGFANVFATGLSGIFTVRVLHFSFLQVMIWSTVGNLLRALSAPLFSSIARRIGWKNCLAGIYGLFILIGLILYFTTPENAFVMIPLVQILTNAPNAGLSLGTLKLQIHTSPEKERSMYFSVFSFVGGIVAIIGTTLSSILVSLISTQTLPISLNDIFLIGSVMLIVPILAFRKLPFDVYN